MSLRVAWSTSDHSRRPRYEAHRLTIVCRASVFRSTRNRGSQANARFASSSVRYVHQGPCALFPGTRVGPEPLWTSFFFDGSFKLDDVSAPMIWHNDGYAFTGRMLQIDPYGVSLRARLVFRKANIAGHAKCGCLLGRGQGHQSPR